MKLDETEANTHNLTLEILERAGCGGEYLRG